MILDGQAEIYSVRSWQWWRRENISITITDDDLAQYESTIKSISNHMPDIIQDLISDISKALLATMNRTWPTESRRCTRDIRGFRSRLYRRWKAPIEKLKMLLEIAIEHGGVTNSRLRESCNSNQAHLIEAMTRLHARSCQIAGEIICLIEGGFADGALARWRSLHEVAVVSLLISECGEELAERYLLHEVIESRKSAKEYSDIGGRLVGYEAVDQRFMEELKTESAAVVDRFGDGFKRTYGWAVGYGGVQKSAFADLERAVKVDHLRSHYRMASHGVHANPKGILFKVGLVEGSDLLLAGPSNTGFADAGHLTAISMAQVSSALTVLDPSLDNVVATEVMGRCVDVIGAEFLKVQECLERESEEARDDLGYGTGGRERSLREPSS